MQSGTQATSTANHRSASQTTSLPIVLLVEDSYEGQVLIKYYIKGHYEVITTTTAEQALELVRQHDVKAIIMDLHLAGKMNGLEAATIIRTMQGKSHIPIIALTAYSMLDLKDRCVQAGCNEYLQKPAGKQQLLGLLEKYIAESNS